jgi:hypothetical protein
MVISLRQRTQNSRKLFMVSNCKERRGPSISSKGKARFNSRPQAWNLGNAIADETRLKQSRNQIALNPSKSLFD